MVGRLVLKKYIQLDFFVKKLAYMNKASIGIP